MASRLVRVTRLGTSLARPQRLSAAPHLPLQRQQQQQRHASDGLFQSKPAPPRLPPDQQAEFERLQRTANTQEGFNPTSTPDFDSPAFASSSSSSSSSSASAPASPDSISVPLTTSTSPSTLDGRTPSAPPIGDDFAAVPLRKGAPPEFEGDVNPKTGEVGGPKNEPLRWGPAGDYSFNGRVTDF